MGRRAKPAKAEAEAKRPRAHKAPKKGAARVQELEKRLAEALEQQTATSEILRVISSSPTNVQPVFDAIAASAVRLCGARVATVFHFDGELIHLVAHHGYTPEALALRRALFPAPPEAGSVTGRAILNRAVVHVSDALADGAYPYRDFARAARVRCVLAVPMLRDGYPIGAVTVSRAEPGGFAERHIALLQIFTDQAVIAVENVRLLEERDAKSRDLTTALEQQTATAEILRVTARSRADLQPVFDSIVRNAATVCGESDAVLTLADGDEYLQLAHHGPIEAPIGIRLPLRGTVGGTAILEARPVHVKNLAEAEEFPVGRQQALRIGHRTIVAVPLLRDGVAIGAITIRRTEVRPFTTKQIELLQTFADQAVIAVENVRLFKELDAKNRALTTALEQQTATAEILRVILRSPADAQPVFEAIAHSAARLCAASFVGVFQTIDDQVHVVAHHNVSPEAHAHAAQVYGQLFPQPLSRSASLIARTIVERRIVHQPDVMSDSDVPETSRRLAQGIGFRSTLCVPMLREGQAVGGIGVSRAEPGPFAEEEIALLQTFADQAAIAIENGRLFTALTHSVEELRALGEVSQAISASLDLPQVLDTVIRHAAQLSHSDAGVIFEYSPSTRSFVATASFNFTRDFLSRIAATPVDLTRGVLARSSQTGQPWQIADIETADRYVFRDLTLAEGYRAMMAVPVPSAGERRGIVVFRRSPGRFDDRVSRLLTALATQSKVAIENAGLFQKVQGQNQELERLSADIEQLYRLSTAMQEPLSLKEQLGRVLETATRTGVIDRVYVWAISAEADKLVNLAGAGFTVDEWKDFEMMEIPLVEAGAMYKAFREGQTLLFDDENPLPRELYLNPRYLIKAIRTSRFLVIPMIARGETVGVFVSDNKSSRRPITPKTVALLQTFASHAAVAIANARLFRALEQKSRELEAASQHKSEFLSNMSHELRTPLNAIIGFSEVLTDRMFGELTEKQEEYLKDIVESGRHLLSLINDILDLSKIEAGRMELEVTDFDLPQAVDNALILVRERATRRGITLDRALDERLGDIRADERKVKQVLLNLLSNALKFTPEGGRVAVSAKSEAGAAEISVTDTGIGIAPEDQEAVFEEFKQVGSASKKVEGTGLGLALCRKFVELHGGKIWVKSQPGAGSTFTFTVPLSQ